MIGRQPHVAGRCPHGSGIRCPRAARPARWFDPAAATLLDVPGRGFQAGVLYGEACRDLIQAPGLCARQARPQPGRGVEAAFRRAAAYRTLTAAEQSDLAAEIDGVAHGANLPCTEAAWVLQLRAELQRPVERANELMHLVRRRRRRHDGETIAGQNADLPSFYSRLLVLMHRTIPGQGRMTTLTPAGRSVTTA